MNATKIILTPYKLAVECAGETYYISNDWFDQNKSRQTKNTFYFWLAMTTYTACEKYWLQHNLEIMKEKNDADRKIIISAEDLNFIMDTLKNLNAKVDNLTAKIDELKNLWK